MRPMRGMREGGLLLACAALAAGEYAASLEVGLCEDWAVPLIFAALVALIGYGAAIRGWHYLFLFLLGAGLFWHASVASERHFQQQPWMRGRPSRSQQYEPNRFVWKVKRDLSRRVAIGLEHSPEIVALNRAILLGERSRLPRDTKRIFVESGTMHVFAISGLHVMAVAVMLVTLFVIFGIPVRWAGVVAMVVLWGYVRLIGMSPSAVRAATMASLYYLAPVFYRRPNGLRAWTLAFLGLHLLVPTMVANVGSALSFAVMLAIMLAGEMTNGSVLLVSLAAWMGGVPIVAHVFGRVTPGGMLANLVLIPTAVGAVFTGMGGILASFVSTTLAAHLNNLSALFAKAMVGVSEVVSRLPFSNFEVGKWGLVQCASWYLAMLGLLFLAYRRKQRRNSVVGS